MPDQSAMEKKPNDVLNLKNIRELQANIYSSQVCQIKFLKLNLSFSLFNLYQLIHLSVNLKVSRFQFSYQIDLILLLKIPASLQNF